MTKNVKHTNQNWKRIFPHKTIFNETFSISFKKSLEIESHSHFLNSMHSNSPFSSESTVSGTVSAGAESRYSRLLSTGTGTVSAGTVATFIYKVPVPAVTHPYLRHFICELSNPLYQRKQKYKKELIGLVSEKLGWDIQLFDRN